jgi:uncharacterized protein YlxP (DUF503 family)
VHVCALLIDVRIPACSSKKEKRSVVRHLTDTARQRFGVAAAEVGRLDHRQRAELAFAAVAGHPVQVERVLDTVERFVWAHAEVDVLSAERHWLE